MRGTGQMSTYAAALLSSTGERGSQVLLTPHKGSSLTITRLDRVTEASSALQHCVTSGSPALAGRPALTVEWWRADASCVSPMSYVVCHQSSLFSCFLHRQSRPLEPPATKAQGWKPGGDGAHFSDWETAQFLGQAPTHPQK